MRFYPLFFHRFLRLVLALGAAIIIWLSPSLVEAASCYFLNNDVGYVCVPQMDKWGETGLVQEAAG